MKNICIAALMPAAVLFLLPNASHAQRKESGQYWYSNYCASCHGTSGKGDGSVAKFLSKAPADLTNLAAANGGTFPTAHVTDVIYGRSEIGVHGTRDMPVWGRAVRFGPAIVHARVRAIVDYVSTLQRK